MGVFVGRVQLKVLPTDFFLDELTKGNFLGKCFRTLHRTATRLYSAAGTPALATLRSPVVAVDGDVVQRVGVGSDDGSDDGVLLAAAAAMQAVRVAAERFGTSWCRSEHCDDGGSEVDSDDDDDDGPTIVEECE